MPSAWTFLLGRCNRADRPSRQEFRARYEQLLYRSARSREASHADIEHIVREVKMNLLKAVGNIGI